MRKYQIEPNNGFFQAARGIVEHETAPACTISFSSLVDLTKMRRSDPSTPLRVAASQPIRHLSSGSRDRA